MTEKNKLPALFFDEQKRTNHLIHTVTLKRSELLRNSKYYKAKLRDFFLFLKKVEDLCKDEENKTIYCLNRDTTILMVQMMKKETYSFLPHQQAINITFSVVPYLHRRSDSKIGGFTVVIISNPVKGGSIVQRYYPTQGNQGGPTRPTEQVHLRLPLIDTSMTAEDELHCSVHWNEDYKKIVIV